MRHGFGTCSYLNGDVYKGKWSHNQKHGTGTYFFHNGNVYEVGKLYVNQSSDGDVMECRALGSAIVHVVRVGVVVRVDTRKV